MTPLTIEGLIAGVPEQARPLVAPLISEYGPAFIKMAAEEFAVWVKLLLMGNTDEAWALILSKLENADLISAWDRVGEKWDKANTGNDARMELQRNAAMSVMKILLAVVMAAAGF